MRGNRGGADRPGLSDDGGSDAESWYAQDPLDSSCPPEYIGVPLAEIFAAADTAATEAASAPPEAADAGYRHGTTPPGPRPVPPAGPAAGFAARAPLDLALPGVALASFCEEATGDDGRARAASDDAGNFRVDGLAPGKYVVSAMAPPGYARFEDRKVTVQDRGCAEVEWSPRLDGHIRGHLYSSDGTPAPGQYSLASGVYSFNTADNGAAVLIYYSYTVASGNKISLANQLTGPMPTFETSLKETSKDLVVKLNACVSPKLSLPFANQKFTVAEFDFQAIADASNNVGTISLSE